VGRKGLEGRERPFCVKTLAKLLRNFSGLVFTACNLQPESPVFACPLANARESVFMITRCQSRRNRKMQHFSIPWLCQNRGPKKPRVFRVCDSTHTIIPTGTKRRRRCIQMLWAEQKCARMITVFIVEHFILEPAPMVWFSGWSVPKRFKKTVTALFLFVYRKLIRLFGTRSEIFPVSLFKPYFAFIFLIQKHRINESIKCKMTFRIDGGAMSLGIV
jgi:hypothetical protein